MPRTSLTSSRVCLFGALALALGGCSQSFDLKTQKNNGNDQATLDLELRAEKTRQARLKVRAVSRSLKPLYAALDDIGKIIDDHDYSNDTVRDAMKELQEVLRDATDEFVDHYSDGSWQLSEEIEYEFLDQGGDCTSSYFYIFGYGFPTATSHKEVLDADLYDCNYIERADLLTATFDRETENIKIDLDFPALNVLLPKIDDGPEPPKNRKFEIGSKCTAEVDNHAVAIYCDKISWVEDGVRFELNQFQIDSRDSIIDIDAHLKITSSLGKVDVDFKVGD